MAEIQNSMYNTNRCWNSIFTTAATATSNVPLENSVASNHVLDSMQPYF